ncbi:MAG: DNA methylase [Flavobacterium sp.]|nr:MAG: DNA methylase [Flavobacterium sp.]
MESTKTAITCLGKNFDNEDERREYFRNELRKKLPELKKIDGFPIGEDDDIINLSDPPYYTACPNPWLSDIISEWENEKEEMKSRQMDFHVNEPYASDISEGKNNPIYNAHSYHTKVPHPAIMRYILHYTQPGDIILDAFAGTGMTGVAARLCGSADLEIKERISQDWKKQFSHEPKWGHRYSICSDLSPFASYISSVLNTRLDLKHLIEDARQIIEKAQKEISWVYETKHTNNLKAKIIYTIWSECIICPSCNSEISYWNACVDQNTMQLSDLLRCPSCKAEFEKRESEKAMYTYFDHDLNKVVKQVRTIPVLINYIFNGKRYNKVPSQEDLELINKIDEIKLDSWFPTDVILEGDKTGEPLRIGYSNVHHFYTRRNLLAYSYLWSLSEDNKLLRFVLSSMQLHINRMRRFQPVKPGGTPGLVGTLYFSSLPVELSIFDSLPRKLDDIKQALSLLTASKSNITAVSDASNLLVNDNSIDYIFTDPPFGSNLMYSELNYLWEAWFKVKTDNKPEAIANKSQGKSLLTYQELMTKCFNEYYRVLKPGKWMTVEFSNTSAAVWNGIQTSIQKAGFIIANVASLDKQQGSFNAVTNPTSVKQDLVISCYKPSLEFEVNFNIQSGVVGVYEFINEHLGHLPIHFKKDNKTTAIIERSPKILYDRLISFYLIRNQPIPIDAKDFQDVLKERFVERDGMYFTAQQAIEYDEKKAKSPTFVQLSLIVTTESEGVEWIRNELKLSQTYQELHPKWMQAITAIRKGDILPELKDILNENFIQISNGKWRIPDLSEAKDRELIKTKKLLNEFQSYVQLINMPRAKKLKETRVEALRAGFRNSWEKKDFETIVKVGDMIPQNILLEDEKLLMYYDIAKDRV